jgi:hypothetical protein
VIFPTVTETTTAATAAAAANSADGSDSEVVFLRRRDPTATTEDPSGERCGERP